MAALVEMISVSLTTGQYKALKRAAAKQPIEMGMGTLGRMLIVKSLKEEGYSCEDDDDESTP